MSTHPIEKPLNDALGHINELEAKAYANNSEEDHPDIREHASEARAGLNQGAMVLRSNGSVGQALSHFEYGGHHYNELGMWAFNRHEEGGAQDYHDNIRPSIDKHTDAIHAVAGGVLNEKHAKPNNVINMDDYRK